MRSCADPDLYSHLTASQEAVAELTAENRQLQAQVAAAQSAAAAASADAIAKLNASSAATAKAVAAKDDALAAKDDALAAKDDALASKDRALAATEAELREARTTATSSAGTELALRNAARVAQLESLRLQREVDRLAFESETRRLQLTELHALLSDVFKPTDQLLQQLASVKQQQARLQECLQQADERAGATEADRQRIEEELEAQRQAHNAEVDRLKEGYEVRAHKCLRVCLCLCVHAFASPWECRAVVPWLGAWVREGKRSGGSASSNWWQPNTTHGSHGSPHTPPRLPPPPPRPPPPPPPPPPPLLFLRACVVVP